MSRLFLVVLAGLLAAACGTSRAVATPPPAPTASAAAPTPALTPFLWQVEKDGKRSHVLGTLRVGIDADKELPAWVWSRLDASRRFAADLDVAAAADQSMPARGNGGTLQEEVGPTYWARLEAALGPQAAAAMNGLPAGVVAMIVQASALPPVPSMDAALAARARARRLDLTFFESASQQLALAASFTEHQSLTRVLDDVESAQARYRAMVATYRSGDERRMAGLNRDKALLNLGHLDDAEVDALLDRVLDQRNAAWLPSIERLIAAGDAFIAVGIGHAVDDNGVIDLLTERGYRVTRVTGP